MRSARTRDGSLVVPLRALLQRFTVLLLLGAALTLIAVSRIDSPMVERLRLAVLDILTPVLEIASSPAQVVNWVAARIDAYSGAIEENARLRDENTHLLRYQASANRLDAENAHLRRLLKFKPEPGYDRAATGRVIGDVGGPFLRTLIVAAGARDGVDKGQAAVVAEGVVGRVVEAGRHASRILLLSDLNSRVPVVIQNKRVKAILAGDNSERPRLMFLPAEIKIEAGDIVATAGDGGVFPPGLPVGIVASGGMGEGGLGPRVQLFASPDRVEYVSVLLFDLRIDDLLPAELGRW